VTSCFVQACRVKDEAYSPDAQSASYWHLNSPSTFTSYSWLLDDMLRDHKERFFYLTAQNLKICNDVWVGMVQFRLGQSDAWVYMGMTTVICDAAAKVPRAPLGGFTSFGSWMQVGIFFFNIFFFNIFFFTNCL
jgi:hypothetical protein